MFVATDYNHMHAFTYKQMRTNQGSPSCLNIADPYRKRDPWETFSAQQGAFLIARIFS